MVKKIIYLIVALFCWQSLESQIVLDKYSEFKYKPILIVGMGFPFSSSSDEFVNLYKNEIGGNDVLLSSAPNLSINYKTWMTEDLRMGISANFANSSFFDSFWEVGANITRNLTQDLKINSFPVLVLAEFMPYDKQFRSYIGGGLGANLSNIVWKEIVSSTYSKDKRITGDRYSAWSVSPQMRIYSGIELGFDEYPNSKFLGSIVFEFDYNYSFRYIDIFKGIKKHLENYSSKLDDKIIFYPASFVFTVALSFNLQPSNKE